MLDTHLSQSPDENHNFVSTSFLSKIPIFEGIKKTSLEVIGRCMHLIHLETGSDLLTEGAEVSAVYFIKEGLVDILVKNDRIAQRGRLDTIGEMSCLSGEKTASAGVKAITECNIYEIERDIFLQLVHEYPTMRINMFRMLTGRLQQIGHRFSEILKHIPHGIVKIDMNGIITDEFSSRCIDYLGYSHLKGLSLGDILYGDEVTLKDRCNTAIRSLSKGETELPSTLKQFPREINYLHPRGDEKIFEMVYNISIDSKGNPTGLDIGIDDVTQRRYYENQMYSYRHLLSSMEQLLVLFEVETGTIIQETISNSKLGDTHFPTWKGLKGKSIFNTILNNQDGDALMHLNRWLGMLKDPFIRESMQADEIAELAPKIAFESITGNVVELRFSFDDSKEDRYREVLCHFEFIDHQQEAASTDFSTIQLMEEVMEAESQQGYTLGEVVDEMQISLDFVQSQISTPLELSRNFNQVAGIIHSVKGLGQSFGLKTIAKASHELEDQLGEFLKHGQDPEILQNLISGFKALLSLVVVSKSLCETENEQDLGIIRARNNEVNIPTDQFDSFKETLNKLSKSIEKSSLKSETILAFNCFKKELFSYDRMKLGAIFPRLERIVRDTSKMLNKKVNLLIEEKSNALLPLKTGHILNACLIQLVKNAVYHGIETPEERRFLKKSEQGNITIIVSKDEGALNFCIHDDGKGINITKIAERAVALGKIESGTARQILEQKNYKLISNLLWDPGFSTAGATSMISGRGIGMSMVKSEIEEVGGHVMLESIQGKSTTIRLQVPIAEDE